MKENTKFICNYCDKQFSKPSTVGCGSCEFSRGCKKIKCPYCGYDNPPEGEEASFLQKFLLSFGLKER